MKKPKTYIFGYTIFNDWSARDIQRREVKVGLGPAKAKDFASSLGPWIVTPEELQERATGRPGVYDLEMTARLNGQIVSRGNWKDLHYSFGEMIARASQDVYLLPGDVIGSGTVGSGCLLEITGGRGPWLSPGDVVELEIERLGVLRNTVVEPIPVRSQEIIPGRVTGGYSDRYHRLVGRINYASQVRSMNTRSLLQLIQGDLDAFLFSLGANTP